jgi:hypothetical protein
MALVLSLAAFNDIFFVPQCPGGQDRRAEEGERTFMLADRGSSKRKKNKSQISYNSCDFYFYFL